MKIAVYPGSFDPVTYGHLDIIERASKAFDYVVVAVLENKSKTPLFFVDERVKMLQEVTSHLPNTEIRSFHGLTVDFAKSCNANVIVRGLRAVTDFEYELELAQTNRKISPEVDTVFFTTSLEYAYLSSSTVKEVAYFGGDISEFVPPEVMAAVYERYPNRLDRRKEALRPEKLSCHEGEEKNECNS